MIGYDHLFLGHKLYPVSSVIKLTPAGSAIGFFDDVAGDPIPAFKKCLASGKFAAYRVHMHYSTNHKLIDAAQLKKRVPLYEKLAKKYPGIKIYISHTCEYSESNASEVAKRISIIQSLAPHCIPVNCRWQGAGTKNILEETHDISKGRKPHYIVSTDGASITQIDADLYRRRFGDADIRFLWASLFNMRESDPSLPPPLKRTAIPSDKYIKAVIRLASPEGAPPKPEFKGKIIPIERPYLLKSFAEDGPGTDVRSNKPLLISHAKAEMLEVVTKDGKPIARFKRFGGYPPDLHRHYSGTGSNLYGYEISAKAVKASNTEFVWIKDGSNFYGPVNCAFRRGYY
jgi:hypothetical protein